ncbi:MAG: phosphoribosylaminoimidazolesuccinocarboxamide synthase, partial [Mesorhizobium sp.]
APDGAIVLADEIHTPDSSRYWIAASYNEAFEGGVRPQSFDKDFIRSWVLARCDPYKEPIPRIPDEIVNQASEVYIQAYEAITGAKFVPDVSGDTVLERIRSNLARYF